MSVIAGCEAEYEQRHNPIWPEMEQTLRSHGASNYSIFLDSSTGTLFGYVEIENEERWQEIARTDICRKWWQSMRHLMPSDATSRPITAPLREVFHLS